MTVLARHNLKKAIDVIDDVNLVVAGSIEEFSSFLKSNIFDGFLLVCNKPEGDQDRVFRKTWFSRLFEKNARDESDLKESGPVGLTSDELSKIVNQIAIISPHTNFYVLANDNLDIAFTNLLLSVSHHVDLWGTGESSPLVKVYPKYKLSGLVDELSRQSKLIAEIDSIAIDSKGRDLLLKPDQKRVIRKFTKIFGGENCRIEQLDGGVSGSRVLKLCVEDSSGATRIDAVSKIDSIERIDKEINNYTRHISRLPVGAYAPQVGTVKGGTAKTAGVFYRLTTSGDIPLFQLVEDNQVKAAKAVGILEDLVASWSRARIKRKLDIAEIRRRSVSDDDISNIAQEFNIGWLQDVERVNVNVNISCVHGDLHGGNVLVNDANLPVMIDYGDVCESAAAIDPITLELSLFSHPGFRDKIDWIPNLVTSPWSIIGDYIKGCPYADYISACRAWSHNVAGGDQAVNVCSYSFLIRQLKYRDVDHEMILALLESIKESILNPV